MLLIEIKLGKYDDVIFKVMFKMFCFKYLDEEIKIYCILCYILICIYCLIFGYKGYEYKILDMLKEDKVKIVKNVFYKLNEKLKLLNWSKDLMEFV